MRKTVENRQRKDIGRFYRKPEIPVNAHFVDI